MSFCEDDPTDAEKARIREVIESRPPDAITGEVRIIETDDVAAVAAFLAAWFDLTPEPALPSGVVRVVVGTILFRVEPVEAPKRQWVPLGARAYAAAVARVAAAGFTVTPSPTHPERAGHVELGGVTFLLQELAR
ncbi:hypothetical protein [Mycobacterium sp. D16Q16]|uniref:hypothetical protein n=1 Tax=Mycobacterium sp. D16Q16 TaxID=1855659 RepID=UPI000991C63B|nr:hypothetical protein [Mycobacterium sp. D16Q16]